MKPSIPRGTRDFGPAEMQKRNYIFSILRRNFELFGYEPIETPTMENLETLLGKYGAEGDKLIFKIIESGAAISGTKEQLDKIFQDIKTFDGELAEEAAKGGKENAAIAGKKHLLQMDEKDRLVERFKNLVTGKGLRYDLTVPFARYVVMNQHNLAFPFKRYQIQPVWRADRPQKGRYREFYQCDADIIGSDSLINELDLISLMDKAFSELKVPVVLKINNRKILSGIAETIGAPERMIDIAIAIDKIDKIGQNGVDKELRDKGFTESQINTLYYAMTIQSENAYLLIGNGEKKEISDLEKLDYLENKSDFIKNEIFKKGCSELRYLIQNSKTPYIKLELDVTLARGLNYYTGTIFEVKANAGTFTPSILGGGRYDDLTGIFGLPNMSGVGISFGVDRIYDVMEELNLFPESISKTSSTKLLFAHFDESNRDHCIPLANELRKNNISCEVYPDIVKKIAKQFDYANKKNIPFVCVVGSNEMQNKRYMLKDMSKGTQEEMSLEDIIKKLSGRA